MRFRKKRGKRKAAVTLTESDIVDACWEYLRKRGVEPGDLCWLKVSLKEEKPKKGRVEFVAELDKDHVVQREIPVAGNQPQG